MKVAYMYYKAECGSEPVLVAYYLNYESNEVPPNRPQLPVGVPVLDLHHREDSCSMGSHGKCLIFLGASALVLAPHSLQMAPRRTLVPIIVQGARCG